MTFYESEHSRFSPHDIGSVYYRRAYSPLPIDDTASDSVEYVAREARIVLRSLFSELTCPWISHFTSIALAENKPLQLRTAVKNGFNVPLTLVTNSPAKARAFFNESGPLVLKPLSHGSLGGGRIMHTTLIDSWDNDYDDDVALVPHLFQVFVPKRFDYRVTVIDDTIIACRIHSQVNSDYAVDMRRGLSDPALRHEIVKLPFDVHDACISVVRGLNLRFGAIDLVEDSDGLMWFLEINPNGQWAWIEDRTAAPISGTIARRLCPT